MPGGGDIAASSSVASVAAFTEPSVAATRPRARAAAIVRKAWPKSFEGNATVFNYLINGWILFALLGRGETPCSDGNHNGCRTPGGLRRYMGESSVRSVGQNPNLHTVQAVLLCVR